MADKLDMEAINALPHPILARLAGGDVWEIADVDVQTGLMRINVCGLLQCMHFSNVTGIIDGDHQDHDPDTLWLQ